MLQICESQRSEFLSLPGQVFLHIYPSYLDSSKFLAPIGFATFMYLRSSVIFKCLLSPKSATTQCRIASTSPGVPVSNRMSRCCVPAAVHQRDQRLDELGVVGCVVGAEKPRDPLLTIEAAHQSSPLSAVSSSDAPPFPFLHCPLSQEKISHQMENFSRYNRASSCQIN